MQPKTAVCKAGSAEYTEIRGESAAAQATVVTMSRRRYAARMMVAQGFGSIINVASVAGIVPSLMLTVYSMSKGIGEKKVYRGKTK